MRTAIIGAGGVGGYFGARLASAGNQVCFVARGRHLEAIRTDGLTVRSIAGDVHVRVPATNDPTEIGPVDYVLVTVKSYDTAEVAAFLPDLMADGASVVSLQNGVDNEEKLAAVVGADRVVGGAAYIFATIARPGVVEHTGGPASLVVGEWRGGTSPRVDDLVEALRTAGVTADATEDIHAVLWSKFAFICAQAGTTAAARLPIGEIRSHPASRKLFRDIAAEVCTVAAAEGIQLPGDLADRHVAFADGLEPNSYSSLHHDLVTGRRMELDALLGEVVRRARRLGVAVPASEAVYAVLEPWTARAGVG
jgi:2-dehydropantoate 2-reductase